ncbi:MAG: hypothetical protein JWO31_1606 [Phycisphaerales bacterium]|nr:hypothetical protein [Phycisphaerales bacterium]
MLRYRSRVQFRSAAAVSALFAAAAVGVAGPLPATRPAAGLKPAATTAPTPAVAAGRPATKPAGELTRRTVEELARRGADAIALGDIKAARDCFVDAVQLDPRHRRSLESLGYCYLKLNDVARATKSMEAAQAVPATAPAAAPVIATSSGRSLAVNLAYVLLRNRNAMRGAKYIKDYLASQSAAPPDEDVLDALAVCLAQAPDEAKVNRLYDECVKFYEQANARLEATRPNEKRWGVDWIPKSEWVEKDKENKRVRTELDDKAKQMSAARAILADKQSLYAAVTSNKPTRPRTPVAQVEAQLRTAKQKVDALQDEMTELTSKIARPAFPKLFEPMPMEELPAVASAAPGTPTPEAPVAAVPPVAVAVVPPSLVRPADAFTPPPSPADVAPPVPAAVEPPTPRRRAVFTTACGFAVAPDLVVTSAASVEGASKVSAQPADSEPLDAEVVRADGALALIRLKGKRMRYVGLGDAAFPGGAVQCVSYPTPALFDPSSEAIAGTATPAKDAWSVALAKHPRLAGAPILFGGRVVGVSVGGREDPSSRLPAATLADLRKLIGTDAPATLAQGNDPKAAVCLVSSLREK